MPKTILITGASGFLGFHFLKLQHPDVLFYGIGRKNLSSFIPHYESLDLTNAKAYIKYFNTVKPDAVFHFAALADLGYCEKNKEESFKINVEATTLVTNLAAEYNIPLVFASTDMVFDGEKGHYTESNQPNPINRYGEHKLTAEEKVKAIYPNTLITRLPLMFGELDASEKNHFSSLISSLKGNQATHCFVDEYRTIASANTIAEGIMDIYNKAKGIYHLGGVERLSRFEFALKIARHYKLNQSFVIPSSQQSINFGYKRPADVSMVSQKAISLGFKQILVDEEINRINI